MSNSDPKPIRLGLVIGQLTVGGAEGQLGQLVRNLPDECQPTVYSLSSRAAPLRSQLEESGVTVREVAGTGLRRAAALAHALKEDDVDIVHSWLFIANAYAAAAKLLGAPGVLVTSARNCKIQGAFSRAANTVAFRMSRRIVVNSADVKTYVQQVYRAPAARIVVVPNGVDTNRYRPAKFEPVAPHVVTVGRLVRQKNHDLFLRAAAAVRAAVPAVRFTIVGDGPLRSSLEAQCADLGLRDAVVFAGERSDVEALLRSATSFWLTSRWEGMPNVVLEAMASGVPVVATDVSGVRELISPGVQGHVVPSEELEPLVASALSVLAGDDTRAAMRGAARDRAMEFSTDVMVARLVSLYREVRPGAGRVGVAGEVC